MAVLADALRTRARGNLGAASLPRHLRRRATSHRPYKLALRRRPNAKRRQDARRGASTHPPTAPPRTPSRSPSRRNTCACIGAARRDDVLSARDAPSRPPLERVGWRRTSGTRNGSRCVVVGASSRRSVDPVAAAVGARSIATREPPRWRDASHHAAFALVGPRASVDETIRGVVDAAASCVGVVSRAFARARWRSTPTFTTTRASPSRPSCFLRSATDDDAAMAWTPAAAAETAGRILDDAARRRGVATRRVNSATTRVEVCGATARDVVDAILGGGRALDDVDGVFGETCEVPRGVASRARTAGDPRDAARRVSEKTEYSMETVHSDVIAGTGASTTDSDVIAIAAKTPEKASAPATPSEYAAYRASRRARAFRLHHRDGRSLPTRRRHAKAPVEAKAVSKSSPSTPACCPLTIVRRAGGASARSRARSTRGIRSSRPRGGPSVVVGADSSRRASGGEDGGGLARATSGRGDVPGGFSRIISARRGRVGAKRLRRRRANANARRRAEGETRGDWRERDDRFRDASTRRERRRPSIERRVGGGDGVEDDARAGGEDDDKNGPPRGVETETRMKNPGVGNDAHPGKWVRALVRCPWGGRPSVGARACWRLRRRRRRRG